MSVHDGHRQRMKDRYCKVGFEGMSEHEILEMILYYVIPRRNTNEEAHNLISHFGSLGEVFHAPVNELCKVAGIGENTALYLNILGSTFKQLQIRKSQAKKSLRTQEDYAEYLRNFFIGEKNEVVYMLCLDAKSSVIGCTKVAEGSVNSVNFSNRKIIEDAIVSKASAVVLAHSHPGGLAVPSAEDTLMTNLIAHSLLAADVELIDHLIFSEDTYISLAKIGVYNKDKVANMRIFK